MTLFDVHTHVGLDQGFALRGWWPYSASARELLERMDGAGIGRAVCFPFTLPSAFDPIAFADRDERALRPGRFPFDRENAMLVREVAATGQADRLLPFAMFDPERRVDEQVRSLETLVGRIAGLKTQTTILQSRIAALLDDGRELMSFAEAHGLPVLFHTAVLPDDTWAQVADCLAVAEVNENVRFCLAHSLRFHGGFLRRAAAMPNVWVDCSAHLAHCQLAREGSPMVAAPAERIDADYARPADVLDAVGDVLGNRYLWGSDYPYMSWCDETLRLVYRYEEEIDVIRAVSGPLRESMCGTGPVNWLFGDEGR